MLEPNKALLGDESIPRITLAGVEWPVPRFAPRQLSVAMPILLSPRMLGMKPATDGGLPTGMVDAIPDLLTLVYLALDRGHGTVEAPLSRAQFDNEVAVGMLDLFDAIPVIQKQAGMVPSKSQNGVTHAADPLGLTTSPTG